MIDAQWAGLAVAGLIGLALGWLVRAALARRGRTPRDGVVSPALVESDYLRREVSRLRSAEQKLARQLAAKEETQSGAMASSHAELEQTRSELDRARHERTRLEGRVTELETAAAAASDREWTQFDARQATLEAAATDAAEARDQAVADRTRAQQQVAAVETAKALLATEALDLKRRLVAQGTSDAQLRSQRDEALTDRNRLTAEIAKYQMEARNRLIAHQAEAAERDAKIGALEAQVERVEMLRGQLEDREVLLRSVAAERDEAAGATLERQRDLATALEQQRREVVARLALERAMAERDARIGALEEELARLGKEREDRSGRAARTAGLIDTLRAEIRDRDTRFQALLNDRRQVVEASLTEITRLREQLARVAETGAPANGRQQDDLTRIVGIGPVLEKLLHQNGVTSFRQIALWTEEDVERIEAQVAAFRNRIRRGRWVAQAQLEHEKSYGERLAP